MPRKNYKTMSKFVKVIPKNTVDFFPYMACITNGHASQDICEMTLHNAKKIPV